MSDKQYVTARHLLEMLKRHDGNRELDEPISVLLALPSIGPRAHSKVVCANFGFDWDKGLQFKTEARLVPKHTKQDIYEAASELLCWLATKPVKKQTYEQRTALNIIKRYGYTAEQIEKIRRVYHKEDQKP